MWDYYRQLRGQDKPLETEQQRLQARFDQIFGQRYPHRMGSISLKKSCSVLLKSHCTLTRRADDAQYVTSKISGGTAMTMDARAHVIYR